MKGVTATLRIVVACRVFGSVLGASAGDLAGSLAPQPVRWHFLPPHVADVFVGRGGRCFYLLRGKPEPKLTVSADGVVSPGFRPILLDRRGWLWYTRDGDPAVRRVKDGRTETIHPPPGTVFRTREYVAGVARPRTVIYEDTTGRVWLGNSRGVQWLDGERWRSRELISPRGPEGAPSMNALRLAEDRDGAMYLWARWAPRPDDGAALASGGTTGFWHFDGKDWAHYTARKGLPTDRVRSVCPLAGHTVLVNTASGRLVRFRTRRGDLRAEVARLVARLDSATWRERQAATGALKELGRAAEPELKRLFTTANQPEVRARIRLVLAALGHPDADAQRLPGGRYRYQSAAVQEPRHRRRPTDEPRWLVVATGVTDVETGKAVGCAGFLISAGRAQRLGGWPAGKPGRSSVLFGDAGRLWVGIENRGLFHWDGRRMAAVSDEATRHYDRIAGRDHLGRILLRAGHGVIAYRSGAPDTRRRLPAESWRLDGSGVWAIDTKGRVWAKLRGRAEALSYYEGGRWHDAEVEGGRPTAIIPGRAGAVFVVMAPPNGGSHLLAGPRRVRANDLPSLVDRHGELVRKHIDSSHAPRSLLHALAVDARGRVWVADRGRLAVRPAGGAARAFRGIPSPRAAYPWRAALALFDGGRMALFAREAGKKHYVIRCGEAKAALAAAAPGCSGFDPLRRLLVDKAGRLWHAGAKGWACVHTGAGAARAPAPGVPVLCDFSGRVWLCQAGVGYNIADVEAGTQQAVCLALAEPNRPLCERQAGEVWAAAPDGLRVFGWKGGAVVRAGVYRRGFPLGGAVELRASPSGTLWLLTASKDGHVLSRIAAPK